jgi:hypothetical protein
MENFKGCRFLHIMSPVKWKGDVHLADSDANYKVMCKLIEWLPESHHYVIAPPKMRGKVYSKNISYIDYVYPRSVQSNRGAFNFKEVKFDFTRCDVDFILLQQPEHIYNVHQWFSTNRYYESPKYLGFYHWIDCKASRGSVSGCPSFYMRQLESFHLLDSNFIHGNWSLDYFKTNFSTDITEYIGDVNYMPLSSTLDAVESVPFDLPKGKKVLVFNHRWTISSGIKRFSEYVNKLPSEYVVWVTDASCDLKQPNVIVKNLKIGEYKYLIENAVATLCFIDKYTTWNLSAQDGVVCGTPSLYYNSEVIRSVVGDNGEGEFNSFEELTRKIAKAGSICQKPPMHDETFKHNFLSTLNSLWKSTKNEPKMAHAWLGAIERGVTDKKTIANIVNPQVRLNASNHWIRRYLLHNGVVDNHTSPYTEYHIGEVKKMGLF